METFTAVVLIHLLPWSLFLICHYAEESLILEKHITIFFTYGMAIREKTGAYQRQANSHPIL